MLLFVVLVCLAVVSAGHSSVIKSTPSSNIKDELRCHCNLPSCVTTGYMCKSARGTCFSEIVDRTDLSKSRHGCIELLTEQTECQNQPGRHHQVQQHLTADQPLVLCCKDDLCNYGAQPVLNLHLVHHSSSSRSGSHPHNHHNNKSDSVTSGSGDAVIQQQQSPNDLWLKAATIAVPIAGGCILVLLVLLAIRLLRRDRLENNNIMAGAPLSGGGGGGLMKPTGAEVYHQQAQHWTSYNKDRQPMLPGQHSHHHHIVYLPTTKMMSHSHPPKRMMWAKSITTKPGVAVRHNHV